MTADRVHLADRIQEALAGQSSTREVPMFGGLSFMVNGAMVVSAGKGGDLLVRVDPQRSPQLIGLPGARPAEMGAGRAMGPSWISVAGEAIATDEQLHFWIGAALEYNDLGNGDKRRGAPTLPG